MANAVWPVSLPTLPDAQGLEVTAGNNVVRSEVDVGPAKMRRRGTAVVDEVVCQISSLNSTELETLRDFHRDTLEDGALPFDWVDFHTGVAATYRFKEPPRWSVQSGVLYVVSMTLEKMP